MVGVLSGAGFSLGGLTRVVMTDCFGFALCVSCGRVGLPIGRTCCRVDTGLCGFIGLFSSVGGSDGPVIEVPFSSFRNLVSTFAAVVFGGRSGIGL